MRKTDEFGIPESSEFIEELDAIFCSLDQRESKRHQLSRKEKVVHDVYGALGYIEGEGLHQFWTSVDDPDRVLESFRLVGADEVANAINETRWAIAVLEKGTDAKGFYQFTKAQEDRFDEIEERVYELFIGLPTRLLAFAKRNGISG